MAEILPIRPKTLINQSIRGVMSSLLHSEKGGSLKRCNFNWCYHNVDDIYMYTLHSYSVDKSILIDTKPWISFKSCMDLTYFVIFLCSDDYKYGKKTGKLFDLSHCFVHTRVWLMTFIKSFNVGCGYIWSWKRFINGKHQCGICTLYFILSMR